MTDDEDAAEPSAPGEPLPGMNAFGRGARRALEPLPPPLRLAVVIVICLALVVAPLALLMLANE